LGVAGGQILGFSIDLLRRPYNTLALPCECVMAKHIMRCFSLSGVATPSYFFRTKPVNM